MLVTFNSYIVLYLRIFGQNCSYFPCFLLNSLLFLGRVARSIIGGVQLSQGDNQSRNSIWLCCQCKSTVSKTMSVVISAKFIGTLTNYAVGLSAPKPYILKTRVKHTNYYNNHEIDEDPFPLVG